MAQADLEGRTAIITGGSRGIGLAIARSLHGSGANVIVTSRHREEAEAAVAELGPRAAGFGAHAADEESASACVGFALSRFGGLEILVNNAGTNSAFGPVAGQERARFTKLFDLNVWAPLLWSGLAWTAAMAERGGAILNVASIGGLVTSSNLGSYGASKAALIHLTRQMAIEMAPGVRVNAVAPGVVRTRLAEALWRDNEEQVAAITPLGRIGEPEDIAAAAAFLVSDQATWITGETLVIDGGQTVATAAPPSRAPHPNGTSKEEARSWT